MLRSLCLHLSSAAFNLVRDLGGPLAPSAVLILPFGSGGGAFPAGRPLIQYLSSLPSSLSGPGRWLYKPPSFAFVARADADQI